MRQAKYIVIGAVCALILSYFVSHLHGKSPDENGGETVGSVRSVCIYEDGRYALVDVEEYIQSTLMGMLRRDWGDEMLRVMAVVIRTGVYYQMDNQQPEAAINGSADGQKLIYESQLKEIRYSDSELRDRWGSDYQQLAERVKDAVGETSGEVIRYDGSVIVPAYHMVSIGHTVSAEEMYGHDIPYLRRVDSGVDKLSDEFQTTVVYTEDRLRKIFQTDGEGGVKVLDANESGYAKTIEVFGEKLDAEEFKERLGLASTNVHTDETESGYRIITVGVGDAIGLSVYGASVLAENGRSYKETLEYYYQGASVQQ